MKFSFVVSGRLKVAAAELGNQIVNIPTLKRIKGEAMAFTVSEPDIKSNPELQIIGNKLIFKYQLKRRSLKEHAKNLIRFISLLACIGELYEPDLSSIYPNLMEVLAGYSEEVAYGTAKIENTELLMRKNKSLADANCYLSLKILDFQAQNAKLRTEMEILSKFSRDAIYDTVERTGVNDSNTEAISKILGTTAENYKTVRSIVLKVD